jgi:DNA-binding beta-propeller fold protein YncE
MRKSSWRLGSVAALAVVALPALAQDGPWNHRVLLATSANGLDWAVQPGVLAEKASVPELFLDPDGRPTILFVDASGSREGVGAMQRDAAGAWKRVATNLREVDPNVVRLADGSYRAYVKAGLDGAMAAYGSTDGLQWSLTGEVFRDERYRNATDPDVFETPDGWVMLVSLGARLLRCTSTDGLRFTTDGTIFEWGGSVSDTVKVPGGWRTFFHVNANPQAGARMRIRSAFTADGRTWQVEAGDRVVAPTSGPAALGVADPAPVQLPDGSWLMAIKSFIEPIGATPVQPVPPVNPGGIETHQVLSATSADGLTWTRDEGVRIPRASVPCAINDGDKRVLIYYVNPPEEQGKPETVACAVSTDGMNFERDRSFQIEGLSTLKAVDPSILKDDEGKFRLYYLASNHQGDPAAGPNPHAIHLALSDDGIRFRETGSVFEYPDLVDPDVFRVQDQWLMYVYAKNGTIIARSSDGMRFSYEGPMTPQGWGTTAPVTLPDGRLRLYAFDQRTPTGNAVRSFISTDGINWTVEEGDRLRGKAGEQITDPFVIPWRGGYKMYFKSHSAPRQFVTAQNADLVLGAKGFNDSGGASLFNHPTGLASDGNALLMADRWNNRVLLWKTAPQANTPPDLVLGQPDFTANNSGPGLHQLNWPGNVAITPDGRKIAVADTNNDRVLIWNGFPERNGAPASVVLNLPQLAQPVPGQGSMLYSWPWGVWTDGRRLAVVATHGPAVLVWNSIPERNNQPPDLVVRPKAAGTPRNVTSDGESFFAVSDHNNGEQSRPGTMVWLEFPSEPDKPPAFTLPEWMKGSFTADGKLVMAGIQSISIWNRKPADAQTRADVVLRPSSYRNGDGPDAVIAQGRLYVSNYNGNNVLGWNSVPERENQQPDFSLGSDRPEQDTWAENFFIQNPALATDGKSLFASSDFDRKLFVWRSLPTENSARPDVVFNLQEGPWDNALHGSKLALAGRRTVYLWHNLPLNGEKPDATFSGGIGGVEFRELTGVAMDARHFYLADRQANRIWVWDGVPVAGSQPKFALEMQNPGRISSDGNYLAAAPFEGQEVLLWPVESLSESSQPFRIGGRGVFNLPGDALAADGRLFVADRSNNRVQVWNRVQDAMDGKPANAYLGALSAEDRSPGLTRNKLFMPGALAWDGTHLWVGEFKFSTRILRFTPN